MNQSLKHQFLSPADEFSPIPFWFWNDDLNKDEIRRQILDFHDKGVNGFVLHPRIGIPTEITYLSETFMEYVVVAVEQAATHGMSVILYDEGMYPSGSANGLVVRDNPEYASRGLKMLEHPCKPDTEVSLNLAEGEKLVSVQAIKKLSAETIDLTSAQIVDCESNSVSFHPPDDEQWSILLFIETFSGGNIRGIHFGEDDGEEHAPPSADLLHPAAVNKFIELTHDTYYAHLKQHFGNTIIAMFTDEPDILGRGSGHNLKPWTTDFLTYYKQNGNKETQLAALWFDAGEMTAEIRKNYQKTVNKRLSEVYYQQIAAWCEIHQIALTGHPAASDDIGLLDHFQIPGQDVVWRWVGPEDNKALEGEHSTAGKCSADAARHRNRRRNLNEFLGVCGKESPWALSPGDMKWYIDWLLVRGVNLLCPHAFYYSIDGKRRSHERPPDVGPNNHWWPYYKQFAQYMKRLSWLMTDSVNQTAVAVLCEQDFLPWKTAKPLFENQIEFNYLEEELFLSASVIENGQIKIAQQQYSVIIIEESIHLTTETKEKLEEFTRGGGKVIAYTSDPFSANVPGATMVSNLDNLSHTIPISLRNEVALSPSDKSIRVSKVKKNGCFFYFIVNEGEEDYQGTIAFKEVGKVEKWDAWNGLITDTCVQLEGQKISAPIKVVRRSSIVYCVDVSQQPIIEEPSTIANKKCYQLTNLWKIKSDAINKDEAPLQLWHEWENMEYYAGTITYENEFHIEELDERFTVSIDLGEVFEIAKVFINEQQVGLKMWAPYRLEINKSVLHRGVNTIRIEVTNSVATKMDQINLPSGLVGPVTIEMTAF